MGNSPGPHQYLRLLHLEDNARDAKLCRIHLEQAGFELQTDVATSWGEFRKFVSANSYLFRWQWHELLASSPRGLDAPSYFA
jgi:hypothetical protein